MRPKKCNKCGKYIMVEENCIEITLCTEKKNDNPNFASMRRRKIIESYHKRCYKSSKPQDSLKSQDKNKKLPKGKSFCGTYE